MVCYSIPEVKDMVAWSARDQRLLLTSRRAEGQAMFRVYPTTLYSAVCESRNLPCSGVVQLGDTALTPMSPLYLPSMSL